MSKNYMPEVAKMLGVEIGEEFNLLNGETVLIFSPYTITDEGIHDCHGDRLGGIAFFMLLTGEIYVQKLPWKPKDGERYWIVCPKGEIDWFDFRKVSINTLSNYAMGNCFHSKEAAEAGRDEIMAKFKEIRKELEG